MYKSIFIIIIIIFHLNDLIKGRKMLFFECFISLKYIKSRGLGLSFILSPPSFWMLACLSYKLNWKNILKRLMMTSLSHRRGFSRYQANNFWIICICNLDRANFITVILKNALAVQTSTCYLCNWGINNTTQCRFYSNTYDLKRFY